MDNGNEFITKFHNLEGITIAEKRKNFNKLLNDNDSLLKDPKVSKDITNNLNPVTHLESLFRVEILLIAKHVPDLLEILRSGNEVLISKIIKDQWFIREAFRDVSAQEIVDQLLPDMSFCMRTKFLKQLALWLGDEAKLYELFNCYKNKYGLSAALPLLLGCSPGDIETVLRNNAVFFTLGQVKTLIRRAPNLLSLYIEEHIKYKGDCSYVLNDTSIQKLLFSKHYEIYKSLDDKYEMNMDYGKRISKRIFEQKKEEILADPKKYAEKLVESVFIRKLGKYGHFKNYFRSLFPASVKDFDCNSYSIYEVLEMYPKNKRYQLLKETYEDLYKVKLSDCPQNMSPKVLNMMPNTIAMDREYMASSLLKCTRKVEYAVYQRPTKSVPYIKNEINLSKNISQRRTLIKLLVDTCKVNDDLDSLREVIKYVASRHRNDKEVISDFLNHLSEKFDLHTFTAEIWQPTMDLIDIYSLENRGHTEFGSILLHYAEFKYNTGESIKDIVAVYTTRDQDGRFISDHKCENLKFLQHFIDEYISHYPETDSFTFCFLFSKLYHWNKKRPEYANSYFKYPKLIESVRESEGCFYDEIWDLISSKDRNDFVEEMTNLFWEKQASEAKIKDVIYFFRWYPNVLLNHKESLIDSQINGSKSLTYLLKWIEKYEHLRFPEQVIDFNKKKFSEEDKLTSDLQFHCLFAMLAYFLKPDDFKSYIAPYKPKHLSVNMMEDEEKEIFKVQTDVVKSLKYVKSPVNFLPLVMSYCGGDFLKHALHSLYKYFHRIPDKLLQPYFEQLSKNAVSIRKHALFLTYRIGDINSIKRNLTSALATEKNMSLQSRFMATAFRCFVKNQTPEFFELFRSSLSFINDNDKNSFQMLLGPHDYIPKDYYSRFYQEIWNLVASKNISESVKYDMRCRLVRRVEDSLALMSSEFCEDVINTLFFKFSDSFDYDSIINDFVCRYLLESKDPERFNRIFKILQSSKIYLVDGCEFQSTCKDALKSFLSSFCEFYYEQAGAVDKWDNSLLLQFIDSLSTLISPLDISEYLKLSFTKLLIKSSDMKEYTQKVVEYSEELIKKYNLFILDDIEDAISNSLYFYQRKGNSKCPAVEFVQEMINLKSTEVFYMLGLMVLQSAYVGEDTESYEKCLEVFKACDFPYVQIFLKKKDLYA